MKKLITVVLVLALFVTGCASSTLIKSSPDGAKAYIDGQLFGNTPVKVKDTKILGSKRTVVLKMDGYKTKTETIKKDEVKILPIIGGILVYVPFLWMLGYPDSYTFELEPIGE